MSDKKEIQAHTYSDSCIGAKRIYASNLDVEWDCPECGNRNDEAFDKVPFIGYGEYCHNFYCYDCGFESSDKMYQLHEIKHDSVIVSFSNSNNLKAYETKIQRDEL